jgi:hypothetical protein
MKRDERAREREKSIFLIATIFPSDVNQSADVAETEESLQQKQQQLYAIATPISHCSTSN